MIMKKSNRICLLLLATCLNLFSQASVLKPSGLLTDLMEHTDRTWINGYLSNIPIWETGDAIEPLEYVKIGSTHPSFSWIVPGEKENTRQIAYRIILSDNYSDAVSGKGTIWDSGQVEDRRSTAVLYGGPALQGNKLYFWRVKTITNTEGESEWSDVKAFRTATSLSDYTASHYPQVKTTDYPVDIRLVGNKIWMADFGKDAFGHLLLTLTATTDRDTVIIHLGECLDKDRVNRNPGGTIRYHKYPLALLKGTHTYRIKITKDKRNTSRAAVLMPAYVGEVLPFRFCEIEGYEPVLKQGEVMREYVHYPFDETASYFHCSNDTLNQIWDMCKYSIKATSFAGIYVDGDRERIPYEADALINQLCHYGTDREYSLARRSYEYLLKSPTWPTEWILQAIMIAWYDYLYTGDNRSLKATYQQLKPRTLMQLREKNGLISTTTGLQTPEFQKSIRFNGEIRDIVDWPHTGILGLNNEEGGETDGFVFTDYNAVTNAFHYEVLKQMADIAGVIGNKEDASFYKQQAESFKKRYNQLFFNKKKGVYQDGISTEHASLHGNMFPLAFEMVPSAKKKTVLNFLETRDMACSVYGSQFLMDALYNAGGADYALHMLTKTDDRSWYNMIRVGSTISLEAWDNKYKPNQDWNHAWGSAPANIIPRKLMGIEPVSPAFETFRIKPQPSSLENASIKMPTIRGEIEVSFTNRPDNFKLSARIPCNTEADIYLPAKGKVKMVVMNGQEVQKLKQADGYVVFENVGSGMHQFEIKF